MCLNVGLSGLCSIYGMFFDGYTLQCYSLRLRGLGPQKLSYSASNQLKAVYQRHRQAWTSPELSTLVEVFHPRGFFNLEDHQWAVSCWSSTFGQIPHQKDFCPLAWTYTLHIATHSIKFRMTTHQLYGYSSFSPKFKELDIPWSQKNPLSTRYCLYSQNQLI